MNICGHNLTTDILLVNSHHAWVSFVGFCEAYNEGVRSHDRWKHGPVEQWRLQYEKELIAAVSDGEFRRAFSTAGVYIQSLSTNRNPD